MSADERPPRDLSRLEEQSEKLLAGSPPSPLPDDPVERLGRRIGRILGYAIAIGLAVYLWFTYIDR
jgi:hypothetical protein